MSQDLLVSNINSSLNSEIKLPLLHEKICITIADELQLFQAKNTSTLTDVCSSVHTALGSSRTRLSGLIQLHKLLEQCHGRVFQENVATWFRLVVTILQSHDPAESRGLACHVMASLLRHVRPFPEVKHDLPSSTLHSVMVALLAAEATWMKPALHCVCACLEVFPGPFINMKSKLELLVQSEMDSDDAETRKLAMRVYSLLPGLGGGGNQGVKHVESWSFHFNKLLSSLHATLDAFFARIEYSEVHERPEHGIRYWTDSAQGLEAYLLYSQRLATLVTGVTYMLRTELSVAVKVPVTALLEIVQRIVAVTPARVMTKPTSERICLASALHFAYKEALVMITSLTHCLTGHMIPYADMINKCFIQFLTATHTNDVPFGTAKPYGGVRAAVYECMEQWLQVLGACSGLETHADQLLDLLITDISPQQDSIQTGESSNLTGIADQMSSKPKKKGSKKKAGASNIGQISTQRKLHMGSNARLCTAALKGLSKLLSTSGPMLQGKHYRTLHELIVPLTLALKSTPLPLPYTDSGCRAALYGVLESLVVNCHHEVPPPVTCAVTLFTHGCRDPSIVVRQVCRQALTSMETLNHPRAPSLNLPVTATLPELNGRIGDTQTSLIKPSSLSNKLTELRSLTSTKRQVDKLISTLERPTSKGGVIEKDTNMEENVENAEEGSESGESSLNSEELEEADLSLDDVMSDICKTNGDGNDDIEEKDDVIITSIENPAEATADDKKTEEKPADSTLSLPSSGGKRAHEADDEGEQVGKRSCQEAKEEEESDGGVDAMLADFVDAEPDEAEVVVIN